MDDFTRNLISTVIVIAAMTFIASQSTICVAMPQQWFIGLVSACVVVFCVWYRIRR
ncbi:MAG: hypothetical protein IJS28_07125 [Synergistaceae bacterium]|nr:hypothetical protein [Synergistaceae bacterium]